ncbi:hypothetical protein AXG93_3575s1050 [Marchantia polymorpha subsp. ruderalis]|uniref:Major facilitator superfamily (MFS) profile domain-containing protein n=1 Tax=Marchantia polymorpha subsp. ruderalis TaxID=1480154 RepID=A0A176WDQ8_MARPO|nr:hypothetical protein AXG93_3575s1050 [Marchantia polymorpha subsp. ruderalis]
MAGGMFPKTEVDKRFEHRVTVYLISSCFMAAIAGFLFGYDLAVTGGVTAMDDFQKKFFPSVYRKQKEARYGRRLTLIAGGLNFSIGAVLNGAATNLAMLVIGRLFLGMGVGLSAQMSCNSFRSQLCCRVPTITEFRIPHKLGGLAKAFDLPVATYSTGSWGMEVLPLCTPLQSWGQCEWSAVRSLYFSLTACSRYDILFGARTAQHSRQVISNRSSGVGEPLDCWIRLVMGSFDLGRAI